MANETQSEQTNTTRQSGYLTWKGLSIHVQLWSNWFHATRQIVNIYWSCTTSQVFWKQAILLACPFHQKISPLSLQYSNGRSITVLLGLSLEWPQKEGLYIFVPKWLWTLFHCTLGFHNSCEIAGLIIFGHLFFVAGFLSQIFSAALVIASDVAVVGHFQLLGATDIWGKSEWFQMGSRGRP